MNIFKAYIVIIAVFLAADGQIVFKGYSQSLRRVQDINHSSKEMSFDFLVKNTVKIMDMQNWAIVRRKVLFMQNEARNLELSDGITPGIFATAVLLRIIQDIPAYEWLDIAEWIGIHKHRDMDAKDIDIIEEFAGKFVLYRPELVGYIQDIFIKGEFCLNFTPYTEDLNVEVEEIGSYSLIHNEKKDMEVKSFEVKVESLDEFVMPTPDYMPREIDSVIAAHQGTIDELVTLSDGRVVSAGRDGTIKVWDFKKREVSTIETGLGPVHSLSELPDGGIACVSYSRGGAIGTVWNLVEKKVYYIPSNNANQRTIGFLSDTRSVVHNIGSIFVFDFEKDIVTSFEYHMWEDHFCADLSDGRIVLAGDEVLKIYDLENKTQTALPFLPALTGEVNNLTVISDTKIAISHRLWIVIYDLETLEMRFIPVKDNGISAITALPDGRIVSGCYGEDDSTFSHKGGYPGTIRIWDVRR